MWFRMLDKFLPPTDNLYKFQAIAGLMLTLSALIPFYLSFHFYERFLINQKDTELYLAKLRDELAVFQEYNKISDVFQKEIDDVMAKGKSANSDQEKKEISDQVNQRVVEIKKVLDAK